MVVEKYLIHVYRITLCRHGVCSLLKLTAYDTGAIEHFAFSSFSISFCMCLKRDPFWWRGEGGYMGMRWFATNAN